MNLQKLLFLSKNSGFFARNISCSQRKFFSSFEEIKKIDMESKNTHLNIDLVNPFADEENDAKPTEWRRYWNINDSPEVQYNVFLNKKKRNLRFFINFRKNTENTILR